MKTLGFLILTVAYSLTEPDGGRHDGFSFELWFRTWAILALSVFLLALIGLYRDSGERRGSETSFQNQSMY